MSLATINAPKRPQEKLLTADEFCKQYGDQYAELVNGRVVELPMPGPRHGFVCVRAILIFGRYFDEKDLGYSVSHDTLVRTKRDPDSARGMDFAYISYTKLPKGTISDDTLKVAPELVVEVGSPSDRRGMVMEKVREYLGIGVKAVALINPKKSTVKVYRSKNREVTFGAKDTLTLPDVMPGFSVPVAKFFE